MSELAAKLLQERGYRSESVRGPAHWYTTDGRESILTLWRRHLGQESPAVA